ncbi:phage replication initiation protein [Enterococcus sp. DIV0421]
MADCDNRRKISQISINTRLGVCRLNESTFITALKEKRLSYGVSQTRLAIMAGISREHLNRIEAGKVKLTDDMQDKLMEAVEKFNPDAPMFLLFDYVRIRFPTLDIQHVIRDILKLNVDYMLHEDYGHYKYTEHYYLQVIMKLCSVILSRNTTRRTKTSFQKSRHTLCVIHSAQGWLMRE